jgi:ribosomal protein S18 acetylase RimI-like enzyme
MDSPFFFRQARIADTTAIANLISNAPFIHRHLDWRSILEWLPRSPFILAERDGHIYGFLACPPDLENIAWIRGFSCAAGCDLHLLWNQLFDQIRNITDLKGYKLLSVGLTEWYSRLLSTSGFQIIQNVVVLSWNQNSAPAKPMREDCIIRPMESHDLEAVGIIDRQSFEPLWVTPTDTLALAFMQAEHASVAEINDKVIGYELSTANHFSAHLARIAVKPEYQRDHIAYNMILEMLKYFKRHRINQITVNTQDNNASSLALYQKLGFCLTGESFPVYEYEI